MTAPACPPRRLKQQSAERDQEKSHAPHTRPVAGRQLCLFRPGAGHTGARRAAGTGNPAHTPFSPNIVISPARENGLYAVGETVRWTVRAPLGMPGARYTYEVGENNLAVLSSGALDLSSGAAWWKARSAGPA